MSPKLSGGEAIVKRVARRQEEESHNGAWKVAFADFCLALLCLFLVLWLLASRNTEQMQELLKNAGATMLVEGNGDATSIASGSRGSMIERHPVPAHGEVKLKGKGRESANSDADAPMMRRVRLENAGELQALARLIEQISAEEGLAGNVHSVITLAGLRLMLHDTDARGMFERGSAVPSARFRALLRRLGPVFAQIQNQLQIVGHTDGWQFSDKGPGAFSNWALSAHRAMAARFHLLEGGMPEASVLQVVGMADQAPLDTGNPKASVNRRIELLVLTSGQAQAVAAMFGAPRETVPFIDGVDSALPEHVGVAELHKRLRDEKTGAPLRAVSGQ